MNDSYDPIIRLLWTDDNIQASNFLAHTVSTGSQIFIIYIVVVITSILIYLPVLYLLNVFVVCNLPNLL